MRIFLTALLGLVGLSMVTYLIPESGTTYDPGTGDTQVLATMGKTDLTAQEVSKVVSNMTRSRQLPPELLSIYVPQIVQQMISDRAMEYEAKRLGMKVSDDETDDAILDTAAGRNDEERQGGFGDLLSGAAQQGVTMADLKEDMARQLW